MFERYTEPARRVLFFARYEASELGSVSIETQHLLLGLLRDGRRSASRLLSQLPHDDIRRDVESCTPFQEKIATSVEIPFSPETKRVLQFAMEEADRLLHNHIGPEHLLLGLMREEASTAATILIARGCRLDALRQQVAAIEAEPRSSPSLPDPSAVRLPRDVFEQRLRHIMLLVEQLYRAPRDSDQARVLMVDIISQLGALNPYHQT